MSDLHDIPTAPFTERRASLRRQDDARNEQLSGLLFHLPDGVLCVNHQWQITFANPEACRSTGLDLSQLNGPTLWEIFPRLHGTRLEQAYHEVVATGMPARLEHLSAYGDIWRDVQILPIPDGLAVIFRDITDRKGAELLRDSASRRLLEVLEATTDCVVSIDRELRFTFLNRTARNLLGLHGNLDARDLWLELPFSSERLRVACRRAMHGNAQAEFEDFYPEPLNRWLSFHIHPSDEGVVLFFRDITNRRRSQIALQRQSDLLSTVQQAARVATWDVDLSTGRITFGDGSFPVFGHPFSQLPDLQTFRRYIPAEHLPRIDHLLSHTLSTGEAIVADFPVRSSTGALLWIEHRCRALIVDGTAVRLHGLSIDISDRKRTEEALASSEARYRILADLNPQAIWMGAPDGALTYGNQTILDCYGFTEGQLPLADWISVFDPRDRSRVREAWQRSLATGDDLDVEARVLPCSGGSHSRWAWLRAKAVRDDHGHILHWLGVNIDVHDRKTFTETLENRQMETERQRAELETVYRTAPIGLALFDPIELRYLRVNDRQAETIGLPADQILGRSITEIAPLNGIEEIFREVASGRSIRNHVFEGVLPARPGEHRFWNCNYSPVFSPEGKVEAIAAVIQEITHQKRAEQALLQSEKLAAVGRLASSISHEINNPLEAITNLFYLIQTSEDLPEGVAGYVRTAQAELSRVCQIVTQTLRFHRQAVNATYVTAQALVGDVLDLYHGRLLNSGIHVETDFRTARPILCFENDIRQVLNNLIANAIDAMRQGGRLLVRAHEATSLDTGTSSRRGTRITIADTGHGMPPAVKARIFEPFYTTKELNGTGLGLWISSGIVARHHGRLTLRSTDHPIHHGTVFSLFLPHATDQVDAS
jgi:PAS domain S-box-containing protein